VRACIDLYSGSIVDGARGEQGQCSPSFLVECFDGRSFFVLVHNASWRCKSSRLLHVNLMQLQWLLRIIVVIIIDALVNRSRFFLVLDGIGHLHRRYRNSRSYRFDAFQWQLIIVIIIVICSCGAFAATGTLFFQNIQQGLQFCFLFFQLLKLHVVSQVP